MFDSMDKVHGALDDIFGHAPAIDDEPVHRTWHPGVILDNPFANLPKVISVTLRVDNAGPDDVLHEGWNQRPRNHGMGENWRDVR